MEAQNIQLKCKKCRTTILEISTQHIVNAHGIPYEFKTNINSVAEYQLCPTIKEDTAIFVKDFDQITELTDHWIYSEITESEWTKNKLKCTKCSNKIGSFDFVIGQKCDCAAFVQPTVHFIRSKVDVKLV